MKLIGKYLKDFALRGLVAMGFGPIVLGIVYFCLGLSGVIENVAYLEMVIGIISITVLAFFCGGITVVYRIEEIPLSASITAHGVIIYIAYAAVYLINGWLKDGIVSFAVFTGIFVLSFALIWVIIYCITNKGTKMVNKGLKNKAE